MTRIDRYIAVLFWGFFIGGLSVFMTIFLAVDALSTMVNYQGVASSALLTYYLAMLPDVFTKMLPVACVMGTVLTLSNLNRANELVALFSSGMSLRRVAAPILVSVLFLCVVGYFVGDRIQPAANRQKNYVFYTEIKKRPDMFSVVKTDRIWYRSRDALYNLKTLNPDNSTAQGLTMYFFSPNWDLIQMITADQVVIKGHDWQLKNGSVTLFSPESSFPLTSQFRQKTLPMAEQTGDLAGSGQTSDMLSQGDLANFIAKNKSAGLDTLRYEVDYHSKFGFALAGLVMCLLGIPFSVTRGRSGGSMMNMGICLALVFGYWIVYSSALTLGGHGSLPPIVAAWTPNVLMGGLGLFLIRRLKI